MTQRGKSYIVAEVVLRHFESGYRTTLLRGSMSGKDWERAMCSPGSQLVLVLEPDHPAIGAGLEVAQDRVELTLEVVE